MYVGVTTETRTYEEAFKAGNRLRGFGYIVEGEMIVFYLYGSPIATYNWVLDCIMVTDGYMISSLRKINGVRRRIKGVARMWSAEEAFEEDKKYTLEEMGIRASRMKKDVFAWPPKGFEKKVKRMVERAWEKEREQGRVY